MTDPEHSVATSDDPVLRQLRAVHRLTSALYHSDSPFAFYEQALQAVVETLEVDRASLLLFDPDGVMRFKAWRGLSREYRQAVEGHTPWSPEDVDADPILIAEVEDDASLSAFLPHFKAEGIRALAFVPLVHRDRVVGKFMLYHDLPHTFSASEIAVAQILAADVALALERRGAQQALEHQQEHLQLALAAGGLGTWEWDLTTGHVEWSPTLEAVHGLRPGSFAGTFEAFQADIHPSDRPRVLAAVQSVVDGTAGTATYETTYRIVRPDGLVRWVSASGQLLRDESGQARRMLGVCSDVTERERLLEAERALAARLASLQRVTAELSRAVTEVDVAGVVLGVALTEMGAHSGSLCLVEGDDAHLVHAVGYTEEVRRDWARFPLAADLPASEAIRSGRPVFLRSNEERLERYPIFASTPVVDDEAFAILPLTDGEPLGCLVVGFAEPRDFTVDDRSFLTALSTQCAGALKRARLYEERERARQAAEESRWRLAFLAEASAVLGASLEYEQTLTRLSDLVVPRLADWCAVYLARGAGIVPVAISHADPAQAARARRLVERYPVDIRDPIGVGAVIRTGQAEIHPAVTGADLSAVARSAEHLTELQELRLESAVVVPMKARGLTIGALNLVNGPGRGVDADLVTLAEELAGRAATAIDNARLFRQRTVVARTLQASLLPPVLPRVPGTHLAARYVAGAAEVDVGGDFYDVFPLDAHRFIVVVGDVCGRGAEAAATAALSRHAARSAAVTLQSPVAILGHINEVLLRQTPPDAYEPRFCSAVLGVVDPQADGTVRVTLVAGGHPLPLVREASGHVRTAGAPGTILGVTPEIELTETEVVLCPGDALVCFTDGATERRNGESFFGEDGVAATIGDCAGDAESLAATLEKAVLSFSDRDLADDLVLLVIGAPTGSAGASGVGE